MSDDLHPPLSDKFAVGQIWRTGTDGHGHLWEIIQLNEATHQLRGRDPEDDGDGGEVWWSRWGGSKDYSDGWVLQPDEPTPPPTPPATKGTVVLLVLPRRNQ